MSITKIEVKNLTAFENMQMSINANVNVIIGESGTGKTHLLKFIYMLSQLLTEKAVGFQSFFEAKPQTEELILLRDNFKDEASFSFWIGNEQVQYYCYNREKVRLDDNITMEKSKTGIFRSVENSHDKWSEIVKCSLLEHQLKQLIKNLVFIPAKDMLAHSKEMPAVKAEDGDDIPCDKSLINIINKAATKCKKKEIPVTAKEIILEFEEMMDKSITEGTILLWDEPEAHINPKLIPLLGEVILELGKKGVQIFLVTYDYLILKYLEVLRNEEDNLIFHALYKTDDGVKCETIERFSP